MREKTKTKEKKTMSRVIKEAELHQIINEEIQRIQQIEIYHKVVLAEGRRLQLEGHSREVINEGIISMLAGILKSAPSGLIDMFKAKLIRKAQVGLGFEPDSFLGRVVANTIEAIKLSDLPSYFGPKKCDSFAEMVLQGISETMVEMPGDRVAVAMGFNPQSAIWMTFRESITNSILSEDGIGGQLKAKIKDFVCNLSFQDVMSGFRGGAEKAGEGIQSALGGLGGMLGGGSGEAAATTASGAPATVVPRIGPARE